jgi:flagellar basal-body rod protein FlgG
MEGMRIASSALKAATTSLDVTSNNLANLNTTGFRSSNAHLTDGPGGRGVEVGAIAESMSPGPVSWTGRSLDLALTGDSFFAVRTSAGRLAFTRDGAMTIDGSGRITTPRGDLLDPGITVPEGATGIAVGRDGAVNASFGDGSSREIGRIQPVRFANPEGLERIGGNLAVPTAASGAGRRAGGGEVLSGALTMSNTDIASEMVNLIKNERHAGVAAAIVKTEDETLGTILDLKR